MPSLSPSQPLLFLSDVHLGGFSKEKNREIEQQLINLIEHCAKKKIKIFVLGDLFDYWMEYPNHTPDIGTDLREQFKRYNDEFGPTLYITGNHDNWTRDFFQSIGFTIEPDYRILNIRDKKLLILHGDGLLNKNGQFKRPNMHRLLRNKSFITYYQKILPPAAGLWIMKWFSRINRKMGRFKEDLSVLNKWAEELLEKSDIDLIICGHDHFPRKKEFHFGSYLNLGTFYKHKTVAFYNNTSVDLVVWNDETGQLEEAATTEKLHERLR